MKTYKITNYSKCGSYFSCYLQSITLIAESEKEAIKNAKKWMKRTDNYFLEKDHKMWDIQELKMGSFGVLDFREDSDY
jgi:hypothetical protein